MKKLLFFILLLLSINGFGQAIIFYDDCEASNKPILGGTNHNISTSWGSRQGSSTNSFVVRSSSFARKGTWSYWHSLTNSTNDGWQYMKAELAWNFLPAGSPLGTVGDNTAYYRAPANVRWFAASTLIPTSNNDFNTITSLLFNTKPVEDDIQTPTYLAMEQGRYVFFINRLTGRTQTGTNSYGPIYSYSESVLKVDVGPVVKNQWEDWVMNRNFTFSADTGYVRLYKNGQLVAEYLGRNWPEDPQHSKEPYMQMGLYKWAFGNNWSPTPNVNQVEMYMDEIRFGRGTATLSDFLVDGTPPPNQPPTVSAGAFLDLPNSTTSTALNGSASDVDGTITSRLWTQISGPNTATFSSTTINNPIISNLIPGSYKFRFTVTDNQFATSFAEVDVKINQLPIITFLSSTQYSNVDSIRLKFSVNDPDGTVTSILIQQASGPTNGIITNPNSVTTDFTNLVPGDYIIRISATDNTGETAVAEWEIQVRSALRFRIRPFSKIKQ